MLARFCAVVLGRCDSGDQGSWFADVLLLVSNHSGSMTDCGGLWALDLPVS